MKDGDLMKKHVVRSKSYRDYRVVNALENFSETSPDGAVPIGLIIHINKEFSNRFLPEEKEGNSDAND